MATPLTRVEMAAIIDGGQPLVFNGRVYTDSADLPTQEVIDQFYAGLTFGDITVDTGNIEDLLAGGLPAALHADTGLKVHLMNPEDIEGGGGGGGGLTDTELRATPVEVEVSNFPAAQPVTDNDGSLTVDGSVSVSNFPATQAVSAASLPLPTGAATESTLSAISGKLPSALSSDALKVDIVGNTAALGGASMGAPVVLQSNAAIAATSTVSNAISGRGYKGIRIRLQRTNTTANTLNVHIYSKLPDGTYTNSNSSPPKDGWANPTAIGSGTAGMIDWIIYPNVTAANGTGYSVPPQQTIGFVPDDFKIEIVMSSSTSSTVYLDYQLLP